MVASWPSGSQAYAGSTVIGPCGLLVRFFHVLTFHIIRKTRRPPRRNGVGAFPVLTNKFPARP